MKKKLLIGLGVITLLILMSLAWLIFAPAGPIVVGRDTTYLTEPIGANGLVDYEQAILDLQGEDVTPEENAAIPLLTAIWPAGLEPEQQRLVCEAIGMPMPAADGMVHIYDTDVTALIADELNELGKAHADYKNVAAGDVEAIDIVSQAISAPWTREQLPSLANWLAEQQPHFDKLHEINTRPKYYAPSPSYLDAERELLLAAVVPAKFQKDDAAHALAANAMLAIGERNPAQAWLDIKTMFTLSRCHSSPATFEEMAYAMAIRGDACAALLQLLESGQVNAALLGEMQQFLADLEPYDDLSTTMGLMERLIALDGAIRLSPDDTQQSLGLIGSISGGPYDQNVLLRHINGWYDQIADAIAIENLRDRRIALVDFFDEFEAEVDAHVDLGDVASLFFSRGARGEFLAKQVGRLVILDVRGIARVTEEHNVWLQLTQVTVALQQYKVKHGDYPDQLKALEPLIDPALLIDPHSEKPLRYEQRPPGFLLYSIGANDWTDNGGNSPDGKIVQGDWALDTPNESSPEHDLVIRFPQPKPPITDFFPWNLPPEEEFDWEEPEPDM